MAIVANAFRVAGTGLAASWIGPRAAEGFFHLFSGWLVFVAAFWALMLCARLLRRFDLRARPAGLAVGPVMILRAGLLAGVILSGGLCASIAQAPDRPIARTALAAVPCAMDRWRCASDTPLDRRTLEVLAVDDYLQPHL